MQPSRASCAFSSASWRVRPQEWQPGKAGTDANQFPSSSLLKTTAYLTASPVPLYLEAVEVGGLAGEDSPLGAGDGHLLLHGHDARQVGQE